MSDLITIEKQHIEYAVHALEYFNKNDHDQLVAEIIYHLRSAINSATKEATL
jgi:hypothetical protein